MTEDERYLTFMGRGPRRVVHWEHWSNPDAETYLTGIDYYRHPRLCRQRMAQLYPQLRLPIPDEDTPIPPPKQEADRVGHTTRWGIRKAVGNTAKPISNQRRRRWPSAR